MLIDIPRRIHVRVFVLDHQPFVLLRAVLQLDQHKTAAQLLSVQMELDLAALDLRQGTPGPNHAERPAVPHHHGSRTVVPGRDLPLKPRIVQWMVLGHHRQPFVFWIERWPFRHRPRLQHPIDRQPEVIVQPRRRMLLHHKRVPVLRCRAGFQPGFLFLRVPRDVRLPPRVFFTRSLCRSQYLFSWLFWFYLWLIPGRLRRPVKLPLLAILLELRHARILTYTPRRCLPQTRLPAPAACLPRAPPTRTASAVKTRSSPSRKSARPQSQSQRAAANPTRWRATSPLAAVPASLPAW